MWVVGWFFVFGFLFGCGVYCLESLSVEWVGLIWLVVMMYARMSENGLSVPSEARLKKDVYTAAETRRLVSFASSVGYDLAANVVRNRGDSVRFEEVKLRLFRLSVRMLMHTDLVLAELPVEADLVEPMSLELRELFFWLLGNRSRRVLSMSDEELCEELRKQLRDYR